MADDSHRPHNRSAAGGRRTRLLNRRSKLASAEPLEARLALAVVPFSASTTEGVDNGWQVLVIDANAESLYVRASQVVDGGNSVREVIEYSSDPSFSAPRRLQNNSANFRDVLVTYGVANQENGLKANGLNPTFSLDNAFVNGKLPSGTSTPTSAGAYTIIPGTLSGTLQVFGGTGPGASIDFRPRVLKPEDGSTVDLVLDEDESVEITLQESVDEDGDGVFELAAFKFTVTGAVDFTGRVSFSFEPDAENPAGVVSPSGGSTLSATYASPIVPSTAGAFRLASGRDLDLGLLVDLPGEGSRIEIASPIVPGPAGSSVTLAAGVVTIESRVDVNGNFVASSTGGATGTGWSGAGSFAALLERFGTNAPISADQIGIVVSDDARTGNAAGIMMTPAGSWTAGNRIAVYAEEADVILAGAVSAPDQSYFFRTVSRDVGFRFATSAASGGVEGLIAGRTVDITLDNVDPYSPTDTVLHSVELRTAVESLRISAEVDATPASADLPSSFDISIEDSDDLNLDAVVSSSGGFAVTTPRGSLGVNASIRTVGDVRIQSSGALAGSAAISTVSGAIAISAQDIQLDGSLQVLYPPLDETVADISVTATGGTLDFQGGASAVNRVVLTQAGAGRVFTTEPVVAGALEVSAVNVDLVTNVDKITVTATGDVAIRELDSAVFRIVADGLCTLSAEGVDPVGSSALVAEVRNTNNVIVSAPHGSVEMLAVTAADLTLGSSESLIGFSAARTLAAGSVAIRSTQGNMVVLDAPLAGFGSLRARAASAGNLSGLFDYKTPGQTPSTLTAAANGSLNAIAGLDLIFPRFGGGENEFRVRDVVLLRSQGDRATNGLYQITSLGNVAEPWVLTRFAPADTTAELGVNTRIAVLDGAFAGQSFRVQGYANVLDATPLRVVPGSVRSSNEITVRTVTDEPLDGTYASGVITGRVAGLEVAGVTVADGDYVLVRYGVRNATNGGIPSTPANGLYRATVAGRSWQLTRVTLPGEAGPVEEAVVVVADGFQRTTVTGQTFTVRYDGLGLAALTFNDPVSNPLERVTSQIGSYDPRDLVDFVVSTNGGSNSSPGSLGRMLSLVQANAARDFNGEAVTQQIRFGNVLGSVGGISGTIQLSQELPVINRPFVLDATSRYALSPNDDTLPIVIDGSRITQSREGTFVVPGDEVHGFVYQAGASGETASTSPEDAPRSLLRGLRLGGFETGAAVYVDGASNVLVEQMEIGLDAAGASQAVKYGVLVTGSAGQSGPVTLLNNTIVSASVTAGIANPLVGAGVRIEATPNQPEPEYVQVVGGAIGSPSGSNTVGVSIDTETDANAVKPLAGRQYHTIGTNPISVPIPLATTQNKATVTFDANAWSRYGEDIYLGQTVTGTGIPGGTEVAFIEPQLNGSVKVALSQRATLTGAANLLTFGAAAVSSTRPVISSNFTGVGLASGKARMVNTSVSGNVLNGIDIGTAAGGQSLDLLIGDGNMAADFTRTVVGAVAGGSAVVLANAAAVTIGMTVSATGAATVPAGTTVTSVDLSTGTVVLSRAVTVGDGAALRFQGVNPAFRSAASNTILNNGQFGIRFRAGVDSLNGVVIQGNYLGKDHAVASEPGNLRANYRADSSTLRSSVSFAAFANRSNNFAPATGQFDFGDSRNNVNSEIQVPLVATAAPTSLTWSPGRQLIRLSWVAPPTDPSTGLIGGYRIRVIHDGRTEEIDIDSTETRYDLVSFGEALLTDGEEYQISVAALLEDATGAPLASQQNRSGYSNAVVAIPAQPAASPDRRPVTRF